MKTMGIICLWAAGCLASVVGSVSAAEFDESITLDAEAVVLTNLVGKTDIRGHSGNEFRIEIHVRGEDADRDLIQIESDEGRRAAVDIIFPIRKERDYVYPPMGRSETNIWRHHGERNEGWLRRFLGSVGGDRIQISGSGRGLEVWADVEILVPEGRSLRIHQGAGDMVATNVNGNLLLDSQSGHVTAEGIVGELTADTGSGRIELRDITGEVSCDTGSGGVELMQVRGPIVNVDTGSGSVELREIICEELLVDTGSGSVRGYAISADEANIDTGSGRVAVEFVHMGSGDFVIDTGSGGIDLLIPADASAEIYAETGSGSIDIDLADAKIHHKERDEVALQIGRGDARVKLDTGSGGISISN